VVSPTPRFPGDYSGIAATPGEMVGYWTDLRNTRASLAHVDPAKTRSLPLLESRWHLLQKKADAT
jgi:hypothetical protein